jgi:uncharacterized protein
MIMKLLLVIGVIAAVYFFFIKKKPNKVSDKENEQKKQKPQANDMIECASCGTFCEASDMLLSNAKYYCSKECVDKG